MCIYALFISVNMDDNTPTITMSTYIFVFLCLFVFVYVFVPFNGFAFLSYFCYNQH